jgi:hypothetical protein
MSKRDQMRTATPTQSIRTTITVEHYYDFPSFQKEPIAGNNQKRCGWWIDGRNHTEICACTDATGCVHAEMTRLETKRRNKADPGFQRWLAQNPNKDFKAYIRSCYKILGQARVPEDDGDES